MDLDQYSAYHQSALIAMVLGDGEITKLYEKSRRKNNSYREHFSLPQLPYREWKCRLFPELLYITIKSQTVRSASLKLFTELFPYFYHKSRKKIPSELIERCIHPIFLAILYLDDGTLSLLKSINHRLKKIYLTANINLYLQSFPYDELKLIQCHIENCFGIHFALNKRRDGFGYILRTTSTRDTFQLLNLVRQETLNLPSMYYKTDFSFRMNLEQQKYSDQYPDYQVIPTHFDRNRPYSEDELGIILKLKQNGATISEIAKIVGRTYWSIVYKMKELKKTQKTDLQ